MKAGLRAIGSLVGAIAAVVAATSVSAQRAEAIVGGTVSDPADYPYFVEVEYIPGSNGWACGGSVIAEGWVLTATHCVDIPNNPPDRLG